MAGFPENISLTLLTGFAEKSLDVCSLLHHVNQEAVQ